jgi:hypothetical protein
VALLFVFLFDFWRRAFALPLLSTINSDDYMEPDRVPASSNYFWPTPKMFFFLQFVMF